MPSSYGVDQDALVARLSTREMIDLTDDASVGAIDAGIVEQKIDEAEAEFHLYAAVYYATPVRTSTGATPEGIREKLIEATAWRLKQRRPELVRNSEDEGKLWADRRKETLDWFEAIASADPKVRLPIAGAVAETTDVVTRAGTAVVRTDRPRFTQQRMRGFFR